MKIVADENIAGLQHFFAAHGDIVTLPGREISVADVKDADVLLVRSVTRVGRELLEGSTVRFVGSCTSGVEHIDASWLNQNNIAWTAAPGCNANAVTDYVIACLFALDFLPGWVTVGVVGCGYVGGELVRRLEAMAVPVIACDPFITGKGFVSLEEVLQRADVITLHTPLTMDTRYPTLHMINEETLALCRAHSVLINASRGAVVDTAAVIEHIGNGKGRGVFDVWENEPDIDRQLIDLATLATPHIAGYSHEGKVGGTGQVYRAYCQKTGQTPSAGSLTDSHFVLDREKFSSLKDMVLDCHDPRAEDRALRNMHDACTEIGPAFDRLRKQYPMRHEFSRYQVINYPATEKRLIEGMGFRL